MGLDGLRSDYRMTQRRREQRTATHTHLMVHGSLLRPATSEQPIVKWKQLRHGLNLLPALVQIILWLAKTVITSLDSIKFEILRLEPTFRGKLLVMPEIKHSDVYIPPMA